MFLENIRTAATQALTQAYGKETVLPTVEDVVSEQYHVSNSENRLYSAWIGAAGIDTAQDVAVLEPFLSRLLGIPLVSQRLIIANDAHIFSTPLLTCTEHIREAVVAVAGTGSVVLSFRREKDPAGRTDHIVQLARVGGWGYLLGDDGSGFFAGREAIREVIRDFDESQIEGRKPQIGQFATHGETLTSLLLSHFELHSPDELLSVVYAPEPASPIVYSEDNKMQGHSWKMLGRKERMVALCPLVFHAAFELKDELALRALRISVGGLAKQISSLCSKPGGTVEGRRVSAASSILCLGGSLFKVEGYRNLLVEELAVLGHRFEEITYVEDAAREGALGLAKLFV